MRSRSLNPVYQLFAWWARVRKCKHKHYRFYKKLFGMSYWNDCEEKKQNELKMTHNMIPGKTRYTNCSFFFCTMPLLLFAEQPILAPRICLTNISSTVSCLSLSCLVLWESEIRCALGSLQVQNCFVREPRLQSLVVCTPLRPPSNNQTTQAIKN